MRYRVRIVLECAKVPAYAWSKCTLARLAASVREATAAVMVFIAVLKLEVHLSSASVLSVHYMSLCCACGTGGFWV